MLNARSVISKLPEWHHFIYSGEHDVIFFTESWLKDTIPTSHIDPESAYNVVSRDPHVRGGDVCALISKSIQYADVSIPELFSVIEICCIDIFIM